MALLRPFRKSGVYFLGGVHAREWASCDILINFIERIEPSYGGLAFLKFPVLVAPCGAPTDDWSTAPPHMMLDASVLRGIGFAPSIPASPESHGLLGLWRLEPERSPVLRGLRSGVGAAVRRVRQAGPVVELVLRQLRRKIRARPVGGI
jgi:hypothetical protein